MGQRPWPRWAEVAEVAEARGKVPWQSPVEKSRDKVPWQSPVAKTRSGDPLAELLPESGLGCRQTNASGLRRGPRRSLRMPARGKGIKRPVPDVIFRNFVHRTAVSALGNGGKSWAKGGNRSVWLC